MELAKNSKNKGYNPYDRVFKIPQKIVDNDIGDFGSNDVWNSLFIYKDKKFRHRVETIIVKGYQIYMDIQRDKEIYRLPGGSTIPSINNMLQAEREVNEEARIKITDIHNSGISYIRPFFRKKSVDYYPEYDYLYTDVYIAKYVGEFKGHIDSINVDEHMYKNGKFYRYTDVRWLLSEPHRVIIDKLFP